MIRMVRHSLTMLCICGITLFSQAQPVRNGAIEISQPAKPYKILTSGKQVTIKGSKDISSLMVWASNGNRIVEQKDVNASSYTFRITNNEKVFFVRLQMADGKIYSEKIGLP